MLRVLRSHSIEFLKGKRQMDTTVWRWDRVIVWLIVWGQFVKESFLDLIYIVEETSRR